MRSRAARSVARLSVLYRIAAKTGHIHVPCASNPIGPWSSRFASLSPAPRSSSPSAIGPSGFAATIKALPSAELRSSSATRIRRLRRLVLPRASPEYCHQAGQSYHRARAPSLTLSRPSLQPYGRCCLLRRFAVCAPLRTALRLCLLRLTSLIRQIVGLRPTSVWTNPLASLGPMVSVLHRWRSQGSPHA